MELIGGTKIFSKIPQIYLTILYLSYIFIQLYLKILFVREKGVVPFFLCRKDQKICSENHFILVSWFQTKGLQREKLSVTAEITKYH